MMPTQLISELTIAQSVQDAWLQVLNTPYRCSQLTPKQLQQLVDFTGIPQLELIDKLLPIAASYSITPISNYHVGAIVLDENGQLFMGANLERTNVPLSLSIHAEQAAIFHALSHGGGLIQQIVVNSAPCGLCRQFMQELEASHGLNIFFSGQNFSLATLLPHAFGPEDLNVTTKLQSQSESPESGPDCLNMSYAPYSGSRSALLGFKQNQVIARGWYIENAAFNPSASPLGLMLSQLYLANYTIDDLDTIELITNNRHQVSFEAEVREFCRLQPSITMKINHCS